MIKPKETTRELLAPVKDMTLGQFSRLVSISQEVNFLKIGKLFNLRTAARYVGHAIKNN